MPIPVNPDYFLCQHIMRPDTSPTSNTFVNTWYFRDDGLGGAEITADAIKAVLDAFYNAVNAPGATPISTGFLSAVINPALTEYRIYDLGQTPPRTPIVRDSNMASTAATAIANEVAAVMSYRSGSGTPGSGGTIDKTKRGRIYLGPLAASAFNYQAGDTDAPLQANFISAIVGGALDVLSTTEDVTWVQYSRKNDDFNLVTGGFVNNAADTQRRRGMAATTRTVW